MVKKTDIKVQETQTIPNKINPKRPTPRHIIIKMPKAKYKERILKVERKKQLVTYKDSYLQGSSHKTVSKFLKRNFAGCPDQHGSVG